jgi:hypothetical protein
MKSILEIVLSGVLIGVLIGMSMSACTSSSGTSTATAGTASLTEDETHRLFAAALAASEFPLDSEIFIEVCNKIGIFDAHGNPNDNYMGFVTAHLEWAMKTENQPFKREINTQEKASKYLDKYLP